MRRAVVVMWPWLRMRMGMWPRLQVRRDVALMGGNLFVFVVVFVVVVVLLLLVVVGIDVVPLVNDGAGPDSVPISVLRGVGVGVGILLVVLAIAAIADGILSVRLSPPSCSAMGQRRCRRRRVPTGRLLVLPLPLRLTVACRR